MKAPFFSLKDQNGNTHSLEQYLGKWILIYFYPKDDTPGCTKEACGFRDNLMEFSKRGIVVLGVSKDSVASHQKFANKYGLQFPLLSDPTHQTIEAFGAWGTKKFMGRAFVGIVRNSYLIDTQGKIVKSYEKINPVTHAQAILRDHDSLNQKQVNK